MDHVYPTKNVIKNSIMHTQVKIKIIIICTRDLDDKLSIIEKCITIFTGKI